MNEPPPVELLDAVTAVVLCGGRGQRLRPFTESLPKPLIPLKGRALLGHLLDFLCVHGLRRVLLCTGYKAAEIERYAAANQRPGVAVTCVNSGNVAMADRILDARTFAPGRLLICYGDTLANIDLSRLFSEHVRSRALATMSVYPLKSPFGIVCLDEPSGKVITLTEKPILPHWINIGYVLCEPEGLDLLERGTDLVDFLKSVAGRGRLSAYLHRDRHLTVNTETERADAEREIAFFTLPQGPDE